MKFGILAIAIAILAASAKLALGHGAPGTPEAPDGWIYDGYCCNGEDCRRVADDDVRPAVRDGVRGWIVAPHELCPACEAEFLPGSDDRLRQSGDHHFHVCRILPTSPVRCLYIPLSG